MATDDIPRHLPERQVGIVRMARDHLARYLATDGEDGYYRAESTNPLPALILTTVGRKSGKPYATPLYFGEDAGRYVLIGSFGGYEKHPDWYLNLREQPVVQVQIRDERFNARARDATAEERPRLWQHMAERMPGYDAYQERANREIPVVILERV